MRIIKEETEKAGLTENWISLETVRSRVKRGNLDAFNPSQQSPIKDIEPVLCKFCIRTGKLSDARYRGFLN